MNIQIFGTNKCFDTKKAQRWFKERGIKFQFIDLTQKNLSKGEYNSVKAASVVFTDRIADDLARRDLTVNAIAYSPEAGFVDPYGGIEDIKAVYAEKYNGPERRKRRPKPFSSMLTSV